MYEFDKCLVVSKSGSQLAEGFVIGLNSEDMKMSANNDYSLVVPQEVTIFVYNSVKGECVFGGTLDYIREKKIYLKKVRLIRSLQKRNNTRVDIVLRYQITHQYRESRVVKRERPIDITILNISAQGMYISCFDKFIMGYKFPFVFKEAGRPIELSIEIVRSEDYGRSFNYGCRFVGIDQKDMDNIFRFVLHEQIEQRKRTLLI